MMLDENTSYQNLQIVAKVSGNQRITYIFKVWPIDNDINIQFKKLNSQKFEGRNEDKNNE